jgi:hypothetical protein
MTDKCVICGGVNDATVAWQTFCTICAKETWGAAVVSKLIGTLTDCHDRLAACEAELRELEIRVDELEL